MNRRKMYNIGFAIIVVAAIAGSYYYSQTTGKRVAAENAAYFKAKQFQDLKIDTAKYDAPEEPIDYTGILKVYEKDLLASPSLEDADDARKLYETMAIKWDYLNRAKNYGEANQQAYIKSFENKLLNYQAKYFPRIRKAYVDNLDRKLWVEDCGAKLIAGNEVRFTGRLFLKNKNKQDTYNEIKDVLEDFRFKRCSFQWHEYDEITTYTLHPLKDRDEIE